MGYTESITLIPRFCVLSIAQLVCIYALYIQQDRLARRPERVTRAAIPFLQRICILEIALGTGDLHLELHGAGYYPFGVDDSSLMLDIARKKFRVRSITPGLTQVSAFALPFPDASFALLVMTVPPRLAFN